MEFKIKKHRSNVDILETVIIDLVADPDYFECQEWKPDHFKGKTVKVKVTVLEKDFHKFDFDKIRSDLAEVCKMVLPINPIVIKEKKQKRYEFEKKDTTKDKINKFIEKSGLSKTQRAKVLRLNDDIMESVVA